MSFLVEPLEQDSIWVQKIEQGSRGKEAGPGFSVLVRGPKVGKCTPSARVSRPGWVQDFDLGGQQTPLEREQTVEKIFQQSFVS